LNELGVDEVCVAHFSEEYANTKPIDFLLRLINNRNIAAFVCGKDFKFGKNAEGNTDLLAKFCLEYGLKLSICDFEYNENGEKISTTQIKNCLECGDIIKTNKLLGGKYFICGEVVKGRQVGKTLGFPTANIEFPIDKFIPKTAVYATSVFIDGREYRAITNVGNAPTFNCDHNLIECHIDGFSSDLYGKSLKIYFDFFIRENKKFDCIDQLIEQLHDDLKVIR
jgi:riboflavin kinase/FMN adenylyltransferase